MHTLIRITSDPINQVGAYTPEQWTEAQPIIEARFASTQLPPLRFHEVARHLAVRHNHAIVRNLRNRVYLLSETDPPCH